MSGIGGIVGYGVGAVAAAQVCDGMLTALKGRGADVSGTYISEEVCLIQTGYAQEESKQPLRASLASKAYVLVFDGEIYNKNELRSELTALGYRLDNTDAAVILNGYMAWGTSCVERFNGVFAFALWDGTQLFIARDRLGLKPMYYAIGSYGMVFASTIKAVLTHPRVPAVIDANGIAEIILLGPGKTPGCGIFKECRELAPGEWGTYTPKNGKNRMELHTYWKLKAHSHTHSFEETVKNVASLFADSVKLQTSKHNKTIATMLSGGLDSSAIAALSKCKKSLSVDYIGNNKHFSPTNYQPESDDAYISRMTSALKLDHKRVMLGSDQLETALTDAMQARGFPGMADIDSALLLFLRQVGEVAQVALSGEGADEIFGGYPWYQNEERLMADTFPWSLSLEYRQSFLPHGILSDAQEYVQSRFRKSMNAADVLYDDEPHEKRIRQMYALNLDWFLQTLASRIDTMAAATGVTVLAPFLDYRLVEYLYNVPWEMKNHGDREKGLLREALKGILPEDVRMRKKSPFPKTHNPAYLSLVRDRLKSVLEDANAPIFSVANGDALRGLLDDTNSRPNWYGQLMSYPQTIAYFLQINAWLEEFNIRVEN